MRTGTGPSPAESRQQPQTASRPRDTAGDVIILKNGSDIGEFLKGIKQPELILIKPGSPGSSPPSQPRGRPLLGPLIMSFDQSRSVAGSLTILPT